MALDTLKRIWKNDYFQTALMVIIMLAIVFGFWYGSQLVLNTQYPALAVVSDSMQPTLNVGDVIIIQGVSAAQINAGYMNGDIIVFKSPRVYDPNFRIVHRAVNKVNNSDGTWTITTHGDNNPTGSNEEFNSRDLIGKVVAKIPYIGNFSIYINKLLGDFYLFVLILIIVIGLLLSLLTGDEEEESAENKPHGKRKLFGKIDVGMIFFVIVNAILIGLIIFSLYGSFTFYQIGADPAEPVTIRGIFPDLQYYTSFKKSYNYIFNDSFSQGFLTYTINCYTSDGVHPPSLRPGVPAFSWMQVLLIILVLYDLWKMVRLFELDKKLRIGGKTQNLQPKAL